MALAAAAVVFAMVATSTTSRGGGGHLCTCAPSFQCARPAAETMKEQRERERERERECSHCVRRKEDIRTGDSKTVAAAVAGRQLC